MKMFLKQFSDIKGTQYNTLDIDTFEIHEQVTKNNKGLKLVYINDKLEDIFLLNPTEDIECVAYELVNAMGTNHEKLVNYLAQYILGLNKKVHEKLC